MPAIPFLWGSVVIGYFALGPYFALRSARQGPLDPEEAGWFTRNISNPNPNHNPNPNPNTSNPNSNPFSRNPTP